MFSRAWISSASHKGSMERLLPFMVILWKSTGQPKSSPNGLDQAWLNKKRQWRLQENNFKEIGGLLQVTAVCDEAFRSPLSIEIKQVTCPVLEIVCSSVKLTSSSAAILMSLLSSHVSKSTEKSWETAFLKQKRFLCLALTI